ncbi:DUF2306 domain-containing protein [Mesorhizobium calcicola]|uniref:DUF2306 domain-containing protein n=1 Tax=Mesorhizobium calcicola TaxID=1300310 RepID=A0ABW4WJ96_9HYPH
MSLQPLLAAPSPVPWHTFAAFAALALGATQLVLPKGTPRHRIAGYVWAALMLVIAVSSFWIHQIRLIGPFSPIHLLSILVLVTVPLAVWHALNHRVAKHRKSMIVLYVFALIGAGIFTLLPGRVMHDVVFGIARAGP